MSEPFRPDTRSADASDLFDLLSDRTRLSIIITLAEAPNGLTFSQLANGIEVDDTGRLNYHLNRLRERLVTKQDDAYVLTEEGNSVRSWFE